MKYIWPIREHVVKCTRVVVFATSGHWIFAKYIIAFSTNKKFFVKHFLRTWLQFLWTLQTTRRNIDWKRRKWKYKKKQQTLCRTFVGKHETSCFTWNGIHSTKSRKSAVYLVYSAVSRQLIIWGNIQCACCRQFFNRVQYNGLSKSKTQNISSASSSRKQRQYSRWQSVRNLTLLTKASWIYNDSLLFTVNIRLFDESLYTFPNFYMLLNRYLTVSSLLVLLAKR